MGMDLTCVLDGLKFTVYGKQAKIFISKAQVFRLCTRTKCFRFKLRECTNQNFLRGMPPAPPQGAILNFVGLTKI